MIKLTTLALSFMLLGLAPQDKPESELEKATFAGGCFWCMEPPFDKLDGVLSTTSGYTAGHLDNPSYEQVSSGRTGHTEAVQIVYDPAKVSYQELLDVFWVNVEPDRQGWAVLRPRLAISARHLLSR